MNTQPECNEDLLDIKSQKPNRKWIARIESFILSICLSSMVILVLVQICLRNFFHSGIVGGDSIVRHLLLWIAFLGAGIAAKSDSHIRIDVAANFLRGNTKRFIKALTDLFSVGVCAILIYAAVHFIQVEYEAGSTIPFFEMKVWILQTIMPIGFLVLLIRFAANGINNLKQIRKGLS